MFADIKRELADFDVYFDEDPSTSFSSASSTPAASQPLKNQHVTAATTDAHDATVKRPISKSLGQPNSSCPSKHSKTPSTEALDEALQPNHLEKCPKTKQASTSTKGLTNATIRDPLAPPVLEQCFDKTENVTKTPKSEPHSGSQQGKMAKKPISGSQKSSEDSKEDQFDSSRPAESAYAIFENVAPTVSKIQSVKAKNLQHSAPKTGFLSLYSEKPQFLRDKGCLSTENSQFDS